MKERNVQKPKRVAFYINSLDHGGAERVTSILANKMVALNIEVTIFILKPLGPNSYELDEKVNVVNVSASSKIGLTEKGLFFNFKRIHILRNYIVEYSPQVLYCMMVKANVIGSLALIGSSIPCIACERNDPSRDGVGFQWRLLRKFTYRFSSCVIAQTPRVADWLVKNTSAIQVDVISNPVEYPMRIGEPLIPVKKDFDPMIVAVGRLSYQKQFSHLIDVFSILSKDFPHWNLAILGEGSERDALSKEIRYHQLEDKIHLVGRVGNIGNWYSEARLFVMTSLFEGYPNALIEAMASGLPVVSYDCPSGPSEIIDDGVNGMLVPANDKKELLKKMRLLMSDESMASKLSEKGKEVRTLLSADTIVKQWLSSGNIKL